MSTIVHIGHPRSRVDGPDKVTGRARYAGEYPTDDLAYGVVVSSAIARGRIASIDAGAAQSVPGVIRIMTHENRRSTAWLDYNYRDEVAPPGSPFRPLYDDEIHYSGQPVALVLAEDFETASYAASLVRLTYQESEHTTALETAQEEAYVPPKKRSGISPPPKPRGNAEGAFEEAPIKIVGEYSHAIEHHNPMEPHASTVVWNEDGKITVYDKIQGPQNSQGYIASVFGLAKDNVRVINSYVGGAFGSGLRPVYQLFLAVMAALELKRSVRVTLTRDQMFTFSYRPHTFQTIRLGAEANGKLTAVIHEAVANTSQYEDYQENVVNWSGLLYHCDNVTLIYKLAKLDLATPADMRAPGAATGVLALETAMDELAYAADVDPVELRLLNYAETDGNTGKRLTSKELRACYRAAGERFGWSRRDPAPRSMREGRELIGWGMASGAWEAQMMKASARARLTPDGRLEVATATSDIGTGTYTILAQIGAEALGLPLDRVDVRIADSSLPTSPIEGGSWAAASNGSAVDLATRAVREKLFGHARGLENSPLANTTLDRVEFVNGHVRLLDDPSKALSIEAVLAGAGVAEIVEEATAKPGLFDRMRYAAYTHSAVFVEVRVDEELGVIRCTRVVSAVAAGRILNPKTARSQILGGVVMGMGMALHEETMLDHRLGRFANHNLGEYHIPAHADVEQIDVIFVDEKDHLASPLGVKGLGEIAIVGTAAAIGNAIFHATGRRVRDFPITIDKLL